MVAKLTQRPFRILALPLARVPRTQRGAAALQAAQAAAASASTSAKPPGTPTALGAAAAHLPPSPSPLILYHVQQPDLTATDGPAPIVTRALQRASNAWLSLGEKPRDSWMYWFFARGEGLMDKIEYEEWALKAITEGQGVKIAKEGEEQVKIEIPLLRPVAENLDVPPLLPKLHRQLLHRIPYHRKMMYRFLVFSPITWPFAIIPVIPNFPLFYVLWRAWSHYKAYRGATYLESLLKLGMIVEKPSPELDTVYAAKGIAAAPVGGENRAPDETISAGDKTPVLKGGTNGPAEAVPEAEAERLPKQARGEGGAPDGTATPDAALFSASATSQQSREEKAAPISPPAPHHPSLMLIKTQVLALQRAFDFRANEDVDVCRAIEQADHRARDADKVSAKIQT